MLAASETMDVLGDVRLFSTLRRVQRDRIAQIAKHIEYPKQGDIYKLGDRADCCYVLVDGVVQFKLQLGDRFTPAGNLIRRGELFGWAALLRGAQRRVGMATCLTACSILAI